MFVSVGWFSHIIGKAETVKEARDLSILYLVVMFFVGWACGVSMD